MERTNLRPCPCPARLRCAGWQHLLPALRAGETSRSVINSRLICKASGRSRRLARQPSAGPSRRVVSHSGTWFERPAMIPAGNSPEPRGNALSRGSQCRRRIPRAVEGGANPGSRASARAAYHCWRGSASDRPVCRPGPAALASHGRGPGLPVRLGFARRQAGRSFTIRGMTEHPQFALSPDTERRSG
jgi:hypothetical protein